MKKISFFLVMVMFLISQVVAQVNYGTVRVDGYQKITKGAMWVERPESKMIYEGSEPPGFTAYTLGSDYFVRFVDGEHNQFDGNYIVFPKGEKVYTDKSGIFYSAICGNRIEYIKPVENIQVQKVPEIINVEHLANGDSKKDTIYSVIYVESQEPIHSCNVTVVNTGYGYEQPYYQNISCPVPFFYWNPFPVCNLWGGPNQSVTNITNITNISNTTTNNYPSPPTEDPGGPAGVPGHGDDGGPGGSPGHGDDTGNASGVPGHEKRSESGNINTSTYQASRSTKGTESSSRNNNVSSTTRSVDPESKTTQVSQTRSSGQSKITQSNQRNNATVSQHKKPSSVHTTADRYQKPSSVKTQTYRLSGQSKTTQSNTTARYKPSTQTQSRNYNSGNTKNYSTTNKSYNSGAQRSYSPQSRSYSGSGAQRSSLGGSRSSYSAPSRGGGGHR